MPLGELRARLEHRMPPIVRAHAERTARLAASLALAHGEDAGRAEIAALIHDIAQPLSDAELLALATKFSVPVGEMETQVPRLLHGRSRG